MPRVFKVEPSHSEIVSKGTLFKALKYIDSYDPVTPVLLLDKDKIREKLSILGANIKNSRVFYAFKANPDIEVARFAHDLGMGFEIASEGELKLLAGLNVPAEKIITSNPVKSFKFLSAAAEYGIKYFAYDSVAEVDKIAKFVPGANVYIRLSVPNEGSEWPLSRKFGIDLGEALPIIQYAKQAGLNPVGITFHVGSQCVNKYNWNYAVYRARELWDMALESGIRMSMLNIGGGYPINYIKGVVGVEAIENNIQRLIEENFPEAPDIFIEPGRAVVGDAGIFVSSVIGKARRGDQNWLHIDIGAFNGLMESIGGIRYSYIVEDTGQPQHKKLFMIGGPSCDSFDVIDKDVPLPDPEVGGMVLVLSAGAYTVSYASEFNGFSIPKTILI